MCINLCTQFYLYIKRFKTFFDHFSIQTSIQTTNTMKFSIFILTALIAMLFISSVFVAEDDDLEANNLGNGK